MRNVTAAGETRRPTSGRPAARRPTARRRAAGRRARRARRASAPARVVTCAGYALTRPAPASQLHDFAPVGVERLWLGRLEPQHEHRLGVGGPDQSPALGEGHAHAVDRVDGILARRSARAARSAIPNLISSGQSTRISGRGEGLGQVGEQRRPARRPPATRSRAAAPRRRARRRSRSSRRRRTCGRSSRRRAARASPSSWP